MKSKVIVIVMCLLLLSSCSGRSIEGLDENKKTIVTTTTILSDIVRVLAEDYVNIINIMGPGIDPHSYSPTAGDVNSLDIADLVIYSGLHLEGKLEDVFESLDIMGKHTLAATSTIPEELLISELGVEDPHVWWDVSIWKYAVSNVADSLILLVPEREEEIRVNLENYLLELDQLDTWIKEEVKQIPKDSRVLITAHDAFSYFAEGYKFEVMGIQGMNTNSEASAADVNNLANYIVEHEIKAVFIEASVPSKTMESLQEAVRSKGYNVELGGELLSDSLGDERTSTATYIESVKRNVSTIVSALK